MLEEAKSDSVDTSTKQCTASENPTKIEANHLEPLIRMCGSQLHRIHTVTTVELKKLKPTSPKYPALTERLKVVQALCMTRTEQSEDNFQLLPSTNRGGMLFPRPILYPFLQKFDIFVQQEMNYETFKEHGEQLFKVHSS